ncbi:MFS transporter [Oleiharenicola lentus]|uniref:MFS transporter n=1 Tax=Oleiharenicola lentus TaxID=2508720 RepID=A0A4Q1CA56_9BACT|nr:MFS transporter [Oleiharenicola lentus]RXK55878.1 MFS transporter [Oleiharenicola lentus]
MNPNPNPNPAAAPKTWRVGTLTYSLAGIVLLFTWLLLGDFSYMMRERSAAPVTQLMLKKYQATDFITGVFLLTIPWAIILVVGPAVSYWSDRSRSRWGRRIPFLLVPTPFVTLSMIGLAYSPPIGRWLHAFVGGDPANVNLTILLMMGLCWTVFEIGVVVSNSVFNGLINDVVPRELLGRFYGLFRAVSLGVGVLFNYKIIGHAEEHYTIILASIGLVYGAGMTLMCLRVKEGDYPPPPPDEPRRNPVFGALRDYWRDCFLRPYYLLVFLFLGFANLAFVPVNLFSIYAAKSYAMSMETYGRYLVVTFLCSFVLAFPLGWLADKLHPLRVAIGAAALYAVAMAAGFWIMRDATTFGWAFLAHGVLSGTYFTGAAALPQMLFPRAKFAQFAAAAGLLAALFNMSLGPVLGAWLDGLGNQYRYTFLAGSGLAAVGTGLGLWLHVRWTALGGRTGYVAPE